MTKWAWLGLLLPVAAAAGIRDDYARQWPLELTQPDAGAYRVVLDEQVYRALHSRDLRDLQVVDADGNPVATAVQGAGRPVAAAVPDVALPWFALPPAGAGAGGTAGDLSVAVERDAAGRIIRIRNALAVPRDGAAAAARDPAWLVDLGEQPGQVRALVLAWSEHVPPLDLGYRLEGSRDLRDWQVLDRHVRLLDLVNGGHRIERNRIELDTDLRYLRLVPLQSSGAPTLQALRAELAPRIAEGDWRWIELDGSPARAGDGIVYALQGRFPVERVDVHMPGNAAVTWTLDSRDADDAPRGEAQARWRLRAADWTTWRTVDAGRVARSPPLALGAAVNDREWRLRGDVSTVGATRPRLVLGYRPGTVVFLAQGRAPYALLAGSARAARSDAPLAPMLATLRRAHGDQWQPAAATLGAGSVLAGDAALVPEPVPRDWKTWLLWGLLVGGALMVTALAVNLLRNRPAA